MVGQKQYSLRDKHAGKKPEDVRVDEPASVVKARAALTRPSKNKGASASRAGKRVTSGKGK